MERGRGDGCRVPNAALTPKKEDIGVVVEAEMRIIYVVNAFNDPQNRFTPRDCLHSFCDH